MVYEADPRPAMLSVRHVRLRFPLLTSSPVHHAENRSSIFQLRQSPFGLATQRPVRQDGSVFWLQLSCAKVSFIE
jgi:hypothetical protein